MKIATMLLAASCGGLIATSAVAAQAAAPIVLELFTSEGCSSCPPADALLRALKHERPDLLVLDFHVDYWNSLGWTDPFSSAQATARQQAYASALGSEVYTPQLVVGGTQQMVGSDRDAVASALAAAMAPPVALSLTKAAGSLSVDVGAGSGVATLWLLGFDDQHTTTVGRGENSGRTLTEVNIVRSISPVGHWNGAALHLTLAAPRGEHGAVLLQGADGRILGAAAS
ncbi:DUF1223 domain-containing protein [Acidisoma cladoniae]|jgi:hypothetical protein|uniref:DUF1223 domain-containing protein n=1 Tax=Acidisoma cladoniae TaxID=3040935 RepID=UPI00254F0E8F|nr:DUF1223 domain-containing protein [Acidisoma sp. PAMC 29798]